MPEIVLMPARPDSPASIVAAVGAADLIEDQTDDVVRISWRRSDPTAWYDNYRPVLITDTVDLSQLAELIASEPPIDRAVLPGQGKGQSLARLVMEAHPDESPAAAFVLEERRLYAEGHTREARLLSGAVGYRRGGRDGYLVRSPLARGAKSDVVQATRRRRSPPSAEQVRHELTSETWDWGSEISGDWGLCGEWNHPDRLHMPELMPDRIASATLARLLNRGIMATQWAHLGSTLLNEWPRIDDLIWPIWSIPMPLMLMRAWWGWGQDPTCWSDSDEDDPLGGGWQERVPTTVAWIRSTPAPLNRHISVWRLGAADPSISTLVESRVGSARLTIEEPLRPS